MMPSPTQPKKKKKFSTVESTHRCRLQNATFIVHRQFECLKSSDLRMRSIFVRCDHSASRILLSIANYRLENQVYGLHRSISQVCVNIPTLLVNTDQIPSITHSSQLIQPVSSPLQHPDAAANTLNIFDDPSRLDTGRTSPSPINLKKEKKKKTNTNG